MPITPRILIACIGNIFLGDDAFGVEVARHLLSRPQRDGVRVVDFGIRGIDLTYALLDGCDVAILVDAVPRGQPPGTLYVIEPEMRESAELPEGMPLLEAHDLDPAKVLRLVSSLGGSVRRVLLVGCEPMPFDSEQDMQMEISPAVQEAIPEAVKLIDTLVLRIANNEPIDVNLSGGVFETSGADHGTNSRIS